jgi:hypothetical protein
MPSTDPDRRRRDRKGRPRRTAPAWVAAMGDRELHALAGRFVRQQETRDLTDGQEWLLATVFEDLEWRRRTTYPVWRCCSCRFCVAPFIGEDDGAE